MINPKTINPALDIVAKKGLNDLLKELGVLKGLDLSLCNKERRECYYLLKRANQAKNNAIIDIDVKIP